jgi:hypothetical protein
MGKYKTIHEQNSWKVIAVTTDSISDDDDLPGFPKYPPTPGKKEAKLDLAS